MAEMLYQRHRLAQAHALVAAAPSCDQPPQAVEVVTLTRLLRAFEPTPAPVHLVHAGQGLLPQKLRAFLDFAAPRLKATLAHIID